jgi:3-deoxy-D-manno-octulosonate 8-phosphate phosphatase (KDO 8-P phosphatase)
MILQRNIEYLMESDPEIQQIISDDPTMAEVSALAEYTGISWQNLIQFNLSALELPWTEIKFIFLDVDGVLTEGGMFYTEDGAEFKRFDTKDGMAIKTAMNHGYEFGIISSGVNKAIIQHRADMFGIKRVYVGGDSKQVVAERWLADMDLDWDQTGYIGDDINDLKMFEKVVIAACPADATNPIKAAASFVLESAGGKGCVREFARYLPPLKSIL